ncbi:ShlB/FhaC/HecB family hemolysin secretion/activation protein [Alkalilimnicola sp. S0819]|uniref:ShlB/FhaC/HecB family hemolysin secretion/activation protein n=1 Tax=Alkalilimnicola sp. S0819 TaxID=2613922 RepID=UPI00186A093E|nr:ShlB/FhaC/HecB family hemolysin secretion/activation protein [Alkalilimnicola sp. S0819]
MRKRRRLLWGAVACLLAAPPVLADTALPPLEAPSTAPTPFQRQQERFRQDQDAGEVPDRVVIEGGQARADAPLPEDGTRFLLRGVRFDRSAFLEKALLLRLAADYVGREIGFAELNELVARINDRYSERGLLTARALIPPQRIEQGVVQVRLVEGRLGELQLEGVEYSSPSYLRGLLPVAEGEVLDVERLARVLRYYNAGNELDLRLGLRPGGGFGETDLVLRVAEPTRNALQFFLDNAGTDNTGELQLGVYYLRRGLFGRGDNASLFLLGSEGALSGSASYEAPVNRWGGRLQLALSNGEIEIIQGPFQALAITGESDALSLEYRQPLWLGDDWTLGGVLRASHSESTTLIDGIALTESSVDSYGLGARLSGGGERQRWSLHGDLTRITGEDILGDQTSDLLFRGGLSWLRRLGERSYAQARGGWQYGPVAGLPASELFQVGGVNSVRGYPQGALSGGRGYYLNLEWHWQGWRHLQPYLFVDHGAVWADSPEHETITAVGLGGRWQWGRHLQGELSAGHAINDVIPDQDSAQLHLRLVWATNWN